MISIDPSLKGGNLMAKYEYWLTNDGLLKLEAWARDGLTDEQIAKNMGVAYSTLRVWKEKFSSISASLKKGKEVVDIEVENALLKRALGYEYEEVKREYEFGELSKETVTRKQVVPDTTAQIFWLKNRRPDLWRDKQDVNVNKKMEDEKTKLDDLIGQMRGGDQ